MRTGAIFARGSCRALKWMALAGMVFALGSTRVAAQAPTVTKVDFDGSKMVTVTMSHEVFASGTMAGSVFAIGSNTGTAHTVPTASPGAKTFTITFTTAVLSATDTLAYTAPTDGTSGGIVRASNGVALGNVSAQALTARALMLDADAVANFNVPKDMVMESRILPMATGGIGDIMYSIPALGTDAGDTTTHTAGELPPGLAFLPASRLMTGAATGDVGTVYEVTYTATDSLAGTPQTVSRTFYITVVEGTTGPTGPTTTPSSRTLSRVSVSPGLVEGGQTQVTVILNLPVETGRVFKARLRLVGQSNTRYGTGSGAVVGTLSSQPQRSVGGVRMKLTGELTDTDYDAEVISELTIQPGYSSGSVTIYTGTDDDAEDEYLLVQAIKDGQTFNANSDALPSGGREAVFMIDDSHTQSYVLTAVPSTIYESGDFVTMSTLHFTPNYVREDEPVHVTLSSSHSAYSALFTGTTSKTRQLPTGGEGVTAEFQLIPERRNPPTPTACACDRDRMDDEVVISAYVDGSVVAETTVTVVDVHKLPEITVTAMTADGTGPLEELAEGSKYKVKVEANRNKPSGQVTSETVTVALALGEGSTATAEDYRITQSSVTIRGGAVNQSATFDLEVLGGDGDIGEETLMLDAIVNGGRTNGPDKENKGMLSVMLVDTTMLNVEPKSDTEVELAVVKARNESEGADKLWAAGDDDLSIMLGDLFTLPSTGFSISADAMSADAEVVMASADSTGVTVKAMGPGTTMVTVTATTAATSASTQVSANIATVTFEIMVDELPLVLMLSGPEDMHLPEGMEAMLTVTANQMVAEDIEVMIMRDRSKSTASDDDFEVGEIMIAAGEMSGMTMVMAVEDEMAEDMEELVLYAMAGDMEVDGEVMLYLWDAAVPALPIIAQLLLGSLLAVGGVRRYRRR